MAGFIEPGESIEEAAHREVLEETGACSVCLKTCARDTIAHKAAFWAHIHSCLLNKNPRHRPRVALVYRLIFSLA